MVQGFWLAGGSEKLSGKWVTAPSGVFGSRQGHLGSSDTYRLAPSSWAFRALPSFSGRTLHRRTRCSGIYLGCMGYFGVPSLI